MNKKELGFFQILGYVILFALLAVLIWASIFPLNTVYGLTVMGITWAFVFLLTIVLRLFSIRDTLSQSIETAWLSLLAFAWFLLFLDFGLCSLSNQVFCQPSTLFGSAEELYLATHSLIIMTTVMSALCFPWGLPVIYLWLQILPSVFGMANVPEPDYASPIGRFVLLFPAIIMAPLGYWLWFCLVPMIYRNTIEALRIRQMREAIVGFGLSAQKTMQKTRQSFKNAMSKTMDKLGKLRKKKSDEDEVQESMSKQKVPPQRKSVRKK